ncbi:uncharacterized protein MELLADRAFT_85389 [Melampsora larici-populina 98AG31]|uniref:Uncharacterized protein n=1 Tax=Melampsora larici-populina (strain 98AG31 / pathotype 3-4-7) TaxID=747676 RepID=F4RII4_MELLP|nr:uncharacterized protein MELLADRAFT_85389 [Melampsora larici-populina 98AG31]EGG07570.1 hypothetical protein MELLADRAFT_85389 [Melampsora larici-populina 98AG31]
MEYLDTEHGVWVQPVMGCVQRSEVKPRSRSAYPEGVTSHTRVLTPSTLHGAHHQVPRDRSSAVFSPGHEQPGVFDSFQTGYQVL